MNMNIKSIVSTLLAASILLSPVAQANEPVEADLHRDVVVNIATSQEICLSAKELFEEVYKLRHYNDVPIETKYEVMRAVHKPGWPTANRLIESALNEAFEYQDPDLGWLPSAADDFYKDCRNGEFL